MTIKCKTCLIFLIVFVSCRHSNSDHTQDNLGFSSIDTTHIVVPANGQFIYNEVKYYGVRSLDSIASIMNTFNRELCVNISCNDSVSMSFIRCVNVVLIKNKILNVILSRIDGSTYSLNNSSVNQIIIRIDDDENIFIDDQIEANESRFEIVLIEKLKKDKQSKVVLIPSRSTPPDKYMQVYELISNICDVTL